MMKSTKKGKFLFFFAVKLKPVRKTRECCSLSKFSTKLARNAAINRIHSKKMPIQVFLNSNVIPVSTQIDQTINFRFF